MLEMPDDELEIGELKLYPYGDPDKLLIRIGKIADGWAEGRMTAESAVIRIETILRQNHRI